MRATIPGAFALTLALAAQCAVASAASDALAALLDDEREAAWRDDPLQATYEGVHRYDDRLPSVTPADQVMRLATNQRFLDRLHAIDVDSLTPQERISLELFDFVLSQRQILGRHRDWRTPINSDSGFYADLLLLADAHPFANAADYERYISRLRDVPRYFRQNIDNMRIGMREGFTLPREILPGIATIIAGAQIRNVEESTFWAPFARFPESVSASDRERLMADGRSAIRDAVAPAYAQFQAFFESEYRRKARTSVGASAMPGGREYYADLIRYYTTLPDATADGIHRTGLAEVARIRAQMEGIVREVNFAGDFAAFLAYLRTDPQFYPKSGDELLREAAWITREIDARIPDFFGLIPRTPYTVKPVPAALAPNYTGGRYNPGPTGAAGEYWVNTTRLDQRPLYVLPALTLHEAAPGHHTQGSLARELENVPAFRRNFYPHAFGEGWGLYSEWLGQEMGIYHTPYERFGRLTYEMWRACRLVVDTGIHAMGWTRQQAIDYMTGNTALSNHEIRTEIDRYIAWPGQALAYKTGEMHIIALRRHAERELGEHFDVRAFHDAVLDNGGLTLPVLGEQIEAYIARVKAAH
ncbi:MAG: DUF885 domain-containing protein [Steroidobacteraceae bacterium]